MLTNLDFLNPGNVFPPITERERIDRYEYNRLTFEANNDAKYIEQAKRINRMLQDYTQISYHIELNYPKLITLKTADLMLGEPPIFKAQDEQSLQLVLKKTYLLQKAYQCAIDISRFGDGLLYVRNTPQGGTIDTIPPIHWYPVVSQDNIKEVLYHVLAWSYEIERGDKTEQRMKAYIHEKGRYTEREYSMDDGEIQALLSKATHNTGLDDFAVIHIPNVTTSDRIYGLDDYTDLYSIVSEIEVRLAQIAKVLDRHTEPTMQGPSCALKEDGHGGYIFPAGNFVTNMDEAGNTASVSYLTWDAHLEANFKHIEQLFNALYSISEMGSALFGGTSLKTGTIPSGSALRRLMISPLAKVNRVRSHFDPALKKAICLCSQLGGDGIRQIDDVSITWQDGLPNDQKEEAEIINLRLAGKQSMSTKRALVQFDGMNETQANNEVALIEDEEAEANPIQTFLAAAPDESVTE